MDRFEGYVALHAAVSAGPEINTVRLWAGGLGTAVVASLMTLTGGLIARDIFGVPVPAPMSARADVAVAATTYALCAAALALQATALLHVLLAVWPRPVRLFACISGSIALLTVLAPFALQVSPEAEVATAAINMLTGIVIVGLLCSTASAALWPRPPRLDLRDF